MQQAAGATKLPLASREAGILRGHTGHVQVVRWNANGQYCLSGGNDRTIRLWNPEKGTLIKTYKGHSYEVLDLDVIGDNSQIVSVGEDKQGRILRRYRGHGGRIHCVRFFSDTVFVTGSFDRTVKVWDLRSNNIDAVQSMDEARDTVMSICLTASEIIAGSVDGCVRRYDIRGGALVTDTVGAPVVSVTQSHDGNCTLVSTLDSTVRLFDKSNGELLSTYKGHANQKYKVDSALTNTDAYVISGSEDGSVCFWDLVETSMVHRLRGHAGAVTGIAAGPKDANGVTPLLTSSTDGTVRYWVGA